MADDFIKHVTVEDARPLCELVGLPERYFDEREAKEGQNAAIQWIARRVAADDALFYAVTSFMVNPSTEIFSRRMGNGWAIESPYGSPFAFPDDAGLVIAALYYGMKAADFKKYAKVPA